MNRMEKTFTDIYKTNGWKGSDSISGRGSSLEQTEEVRKIIPYVIEILGAKSMLDIPCGDMYWMARVKFPQDFHYIGADVVNDLVLKGDKMRGKVFVAEFAQLDITKDGLPSVDIVFVRDLFGHLSNQEVKMALKNIKKSGAKYLLATTFPNTTETTDIKTGDWRPINLDYMWGLPKPIAIFNEGCTEGAGNFKDKSLGLWRLS